MNRPKESQIIPLDRTFVRVPDDVSNVIAFTDRRRFGVGPIRWAQLLEQSCVVVLGEAGIGKTAELRGCVTSIVQSGNAAFFLPVDALASRGAERTLAADPQLFRTWRSATDGEAWFMLDAVDESALRGRTLSDALSNLCDELDHNLSRARLIVSSRASDWRSADDAELRTLAERLAPPLRGAELFALVQLAPLTEAQVTALCVHWGMTDVAAFLQAVRDANAWSFLERPLDVRWLSRYWTTEGRLGSLRDLVEFNIDERLKEKQGRPTLIAAARAKDGAATISLVASLARRSAFLVPGDDVDPRAVDALDPKDVLSDWRNEELQDLLARGLFDEATYGRVRVHHRTVHEYLAAARLAQMLKDGFPRSDLNALFFRESSGRTVVPRNLTAILAWLALFDPEIRRLATRIAPEYLVDEGDPSGIPADERRNILRAYADRFRDRERVFHHFDSIGLRRFACVELTTTIRELLTASGEPEHLRELLLRLIAKGRLAILTDVALTIALSPATSVIVRLAAIRAVRDSGGDADRAQLANLLTASAAQDPEVAAALLEALFPTLLAVPDAVALLQRVTRLPRSTITSIDVLVPKLPERCSPDQRRELLAGLILLLRAPASSPGRPVLEPQGAWLAECVAELLGLIVEDGTPLPDEAPEALELIDEARYHPDGPPMPHVSAALDRHPQLRRAIFWRAIGAFEDEQRRQARTYWDATAACARLGTQDLAWLAEDALLRAQSRERALTFDCLWHLSQRGIEDASQREAVLSRIAQESDAAHGDKALVRKLQRKANPPFYVPREAFSRMRLRERARALRETRTLESNRQILNSILPEIAAGARSDVLLHLFERCRSREPGGRGTISFTAISERYGSAVAEATRRGLKAFWRINRPIRIEDHEPHSVPFHAIIGLLGIALDVADGLSVSTLSYELQRAVVEYAPWSLNRFPEWFENVARDHAQLVRDVLRPPIQLDYAALPPKQEPELGRVLYKISRAPEAVRQACAPELTELLLVSDPPYVRVLQDTLDVIDGVSAIPRIQFIALAEQRCRASANDPARFAIWWCQWFALDAMPALAALEALLGAHPGPRELAEETFSRLWMLTDSRSAQGRVPLKSNRDALICLIPIVFRYIRAADDIVHQGAHIVERRDHCQDLRAALLPWLSGVEGTPTVEALEHLATEPWLAQGAEWIRHLAAVRAVDDATARALTVTQAAAFVRNLVLEPTTVAQLFGIVLNRLEDIRLNLAHDDFSVRDAYSPAKAPILEEPVQNLLAQRLEDARRQQYTVAREPEVTRKKKPDIRVANPRCEGPVTLEVKIAERWTLPQLEEAIRDQLVGTYMKANNSKYGVLVLCSSGPRKHWEQPSLGKLDFQGIAEHLRKFAANLASSTTSISGLRVVTIDFH
ncbi:hypothetical protein WME95_17060 [Sorangium sp. So ce327]|uniref:hypothetical protein n=1 Tax=Sorangium sp. So ce327 TaxID=3133301 RepID=UPI003F5DA7AC